MNIFNIQTWKKLWQKLEIIWQSRYPIVKYLKNYKNSNKKLTWKNINNFFEAKERELNKKQWEKDQANWRLEQVKIKSPICIKQGFCKGCKCEWKDGLHYESESCKEPEKCYPKWMNKEEWENINV